MKARTFIAFSLLLVGVIVFSVPKLRVQTIHILSTSECNTPTPFKLGVLDQRFGLSEATALADINTATEIWSKNYGKSLFANTPSAALTVNFVYDQRSALSTQIEQQQNQLGQSNTTIQKQINSYEADVAVFEQKLANFNTQVDQINKSGGASPEEYQTLISQQNELKDEGSALNVRAQQLNLATRNYNSKVKGLNQNVTQFNEAIAQKPEEGLYEENNQTITIYFVRDHQELIHTLAHEFGHALGMGHTDSSKSIMYPYSTSSVSVTSQDKQQLDYACREKLLPILWLQESAKWVHSIVSHIVSNT